MSQQGKPAIVVIGGGTGSGAVLTGLKDRAEVTAVVNMADDGGSTGVLRRELGVLPGGDVWKCMAALSDDEKIRELFAYRFTEGELKGHSIGNILMAASEKVGGSFIRAVEMIAEIVHVKGRVVPVTVDDVRLVMTWPALDIVLNGEHLIDVTHFEHDPRQAVLSLVPTARPNPAALSAIREADVVVVAPGDLYTSLGSQLVIDEIGQALRETAAVKVYVANLITKPGHTDTFTVADHAAEIERFAGGQCLDYVLYNTEEIPQEDGVSGVVANTAELETKHYRAIAGNFLGAKVGQDASEVFSVAKRSAVRHDPSAVAGAIMALYEQTNR